MSGNVDCQKRPQMFFSAGCRGNNNKAISATWNSQTPCILIFVHFHGFCLNFDKNPHIFCGLQCLRPAVSRTRLVETKNEIKYDRNFAIYHHAWGCLKIIICLTGIKRAVFRVFCPWLAGEVGFRGSLASFMAAVAFPVLELLLGARRYCCSGLALSKQSSASTAAQSSTRSRIFSVVAGWCRVRGAGAQMVTTSRRGNFICTTEGTRN